MLVEFQQAFADLVASPELCVSVRVNPELLNEQYKLSLQEFRQLVAVVNHPGMECNCMLYRANRLVPLALNLPELCKALGKKLPDTLSRYWATCRYGDSHFLLECQRFCEFVEQLLTDGEPFSDEVRLALERESPVIALRVQASSQTNHD
ncbi:MAG TPA: hypothetical protein VFM63_04765 [Pyrinomonadaceae bacterium]|nr:hypothetical protein [Pyrinomonadaceae bacterium]